MKPETEDYTRERGHTTYLNSDMLRMFLLYFALPFSGVVNLGSFNQQPVFLVFRQISTPIYVYICSNHADATTCYGNYWHPLQNKIYQSESTKRNSVRYAPCQ